MVSTLARLHRVDPAAVGLADLGRPDGYVSRQVERWTRQYRASERTRIAPMEEAIAWIGGHRTEEHTSELQSLMRISYAVFCLSKKKTSIFIYNTDTSVNTQRKTTKSR